MLDIPAIVEQLYEWLCAQGLEVVKLDFTDGLILQARRQRRRYTKLPAQVPDAVVIRVTEHDDGVLFQFRTGKWHDRSMLAATWTSLAAWIVLVGFLPETVFFAGIGLITVGLTHYYHPIQLLVERAAEITDQLVYSGEYGSPSDAA